MPLAKVSQSKEKDFKVAIRVQTFWGIEMHQSLCFQHVVFNILQRNSYLKTEDPLAMAGPTFQKTYPRVTPAESYCG